MADKKISALTASTTPLAGTEVLPIVQSGSTVKVAVSDLTAGRAVSATQLTLSTNNLIFSTTGKGVTTGSAIPLGLGVNNSVAAITIDTGSNVGVGTASPITKFDVFSATDTYAAVRSTSQTMAFNAGTGFTGSAATSIYNLSAIPMVIGTNSTPRITISAAGDATVNTGNLVIGTAGKGIDFSANSHAAGMTSELLNDYEEGTWTPTLATNGFSGGVTLSSASGTYTKIGRQVTLQCTLNLSNFAYPLTLVEIGAIPYTPATRNAGAYMGAHPSSSMGGACGVTNGGTVIYIPPSVAIGTSTVWAVTITYFV